MRFPYLLQGGAGEFLVLTSRNRLFYARIDTESAVEVNGNSINNNHIKDDDDNDSDNELMVICVA